MVFKIDTHVHTDASHDCDTSVREVLDNAVSRGLDGVAITDHDTVENHDEALDLAKDFDLTVIPGIEITTSAGHLLGLNVEKKIESGLSLEETIDRIREQNGVAVVPHPFQFFRHGVSKSELEKVEPDAVEVFNSRLIVGLRNLQSDRYAQSRGYPKVAGSDAHVPGLVGTAYTVVESSGSVKDVLQGIREGRTSIHREKTPVSSFIRQIISNNWRTKL